MRGRGKDGGGEGRERWMPGMEMVRGRGMDDDGEGTKTVMCSENGRERWIGKDGVEGRRGRGKMKGGFGRK